MNEYALTVIVARREILALINNNTEITVQSLKEQYENRLHSAVKEAVWQLLDEETITLTTEHYLVLNPDLG